MKDLETKDDSTTKIPQKYCQWSENNGIMVVELKSEKKGANSRTEMIRSFNDIHQTEMKKKIVHWNVYEQKDSDGLK